MRPGSTVACLASASRAALKRACIACGSFMTPLDSAPASLGLSADFAPPYMSAMNAV
jgi:hypothetical protein